MLERNGGKLVLVVLCSLFFYIVLILVSDVGLISEIFSKIRIEFVFLVLLIQLAAHFVKSLRQREFFKAQDINLSLKHNFLTYIAGMSLVATPGGVGTFIKLYFLKQKFNAEYSKTFPVVFLERYHDLLAASTIILFTVFVSYSWLSVVLLLIIVSLLISVFFMMKKFSVFLLLRDKLSKIKFVGKLVQIDDSHFVSFERLTRAPVMFRGWIIGTAGWCLDAFAVYVGFLAFGVDLGLAITSQVYLTSLGYGILSLLPGGIVVTESMADFLLIRQGLGLSVASSLVIFTRLTTIWFVTVLGMILTRNALR